MCYTIFGNNLFSAESYVRNFFKKIDFLDAFKGCFHFIKSFA